VNAAASFFRSIRKADARRAIHTTTFRLPRFVEVAERAGIADTFDGRAIALADFNLDGRIDIYVANQIAPSCYYVSQSRAPREDKRAFLRLTLEGRPPYPRLDQRRGRRARHAPGRHG
jgi:hypothetical protein